MAPDKRAPRRRGKGDLQTTSACDDSGQDTDAGKQAVDDQKNTELPPDRRVLYKPVYHIPTIPGRLEHIRIIRMKDSDDCEAEATSPNIVNFLIPMNSGCFPRLAIRLPTRAWRRWKDFQEEGYAEIRMRNVFIVNAHPKPYEIGADI